MWNYLFFVYSRINNSHSNLCKNLYTNPSQSHQLRKKNPPFLSFFLLLISTCMAPSCLLSRSFSLFRDCTHTPWNFCLYSAITHCNVSFPNSNSGAKGLTNTDWSRIHTYTHFYQRIMWLVRQRGSLSSYVLCTCGSSLVSSFAQQHRLVLWPLLPLLSLSSLSSLSSFIAFASKTYDFNFIIWNLITCFMCICTSMFTHTSLNIQFINNIYCCCCCCCWCF